MLRLSKGNQVNIPGPGKGEYSNLKLPAVWLGVETSGNTHKLGDVGGSSGESFLFLLTAYCSLEADHLEIGLTWLFILVEQSDLWAVRCALDGP